MRPDKDGVSTCGDALEKFIALCLDSGSGIACPCLGFANIKTLASTRIEIATLGDEVRTALDLKTCRQNYKAKLDLVKELLRATITGKTTIQQRRTALEKKEESKANKEEAKRKKDEIKEAAKEAKRQKAAAASAASAAEKKEVVQQVQPVGVPASQFNISMLNLDQLGHP